MPSSDLSGLSPLGRMIDSAFRDIAEGRVIVRQVEVDEPGAYDARKVRALRAKLKVSQGVFAMLVGVSPQLVEAWEQGVREPSGLARRLFDQIAVDPTEFRARLMRRVRGTASTKRRVS